MVVGFGGFALRIVVSGFIGVFILMPFLLAMSYLGMSVNPLVYMVIYLFGWVIGLYVSFLLLFRGRTFG